jgi:hypothetical protein
MPESCVQSKHFVIVILVSCNWSCGSDELDQEGTKPRKVCKESVSSLVQKCVPERPREYEMVGFINNKIWMMVLKNTTFNYEEATRK